MHSNNKHGSFFRLTVLYCTVYTVLCCKYCTLLFKLYCIYCTVYTVLYCIYCTVNKISADLLSEKTSAWAVHEEGWKTEDLKEDMKDGVYEKDERKEGEEEEN